VREHLDVVRRTVAHVLTRVPTHVSRDDLTSAAMAGLAMAARQFDPARGVPFERYAATRVRGAVIDELRSYDWASRPVRTKARALASISEVLTNTLGRSPTQTELADAAGLSVPALQRLTGDVHRAVMVNLESLPDAGDAGALATSETGDPETELLNREQAACVARAIDALPERLRHVIRAYFFEDRTVTDIAAELGVTQSRVSQLRAEAVELLRDGVNAQLDPGRVDTHTATRLSRRQAAYRAAFAAAPGGRATARPRAADKVGARV